MKPQYLFRPRQIFLRLWRSSAHGTRTVTLPWGTPLRVNTDEAIGRALWNTEVYDLPVTEALWRLTDAGETAFDVGANVGYMTTVLASRGARVFAFEPHPAVFESLKSNVAALPAVTPLRLAASDLNGTLRLSSTPDFSHNEGASRVCDDGEFEVEAARLDSVGVDRVQVMKLDVEGHEMKALVGLGGLPVRDIVFEEHRGDSPAADLLRSRGYEVFHLAGSTFGPVVSHEPLPRKSWEPPSCLATLNPFRALARLDPHGWQCLTSRPARG